MTVERWGSEREEVWSASDLAGVYTPPPEDADSLGCRWPVSLEIPIDDDWRSGFYLVTLTRDRRRAGPGRRPHRLRRASAR